MKLIIRNIDEYWVKLTLLSLYILMIPLVFPLLGFGQGIQFIGGNQPIEERTSVELFAEDMPAFHEPFTIDFDLQLPSNNTIGYIIRIKEKKQNPIFNLYFDKDDEYAVFRLNEEGKNSLITVRIAMSSLKERHWFPVKIEFDIEKSNISLEIADRPKETAKVSLQSPYSPAISFGRSDYMIDVPSISLQNLRVSDTHKEIIFPLRESSGNKLHDASGKVMGRVMNGIWLLNNAFHWQQHASMHSSSPAGSAYDAKQKAIYYFNRDSLQVYEIQSGEIKTFRFATPCPLPLKLGNCFINADENRLYAYETYQDIPYTGTTVASLNLDSLTWKIESGDDLHRELNHHGSYFFNKEHKLLIFGGFGNMIYSNDFQYYNLNEKKWSAPIDVKGDSIFPRYFTAVGRSEKNQHIYIFGGMGNESGQHIVGREYFYDLYEFDPASDSLKKLWDIDWTGSPFVPARGLVIPDTEWVYLLGYPEHLTHSHIKLRRFSVYNGQYEELGDSIPIYSDKINTRATLSFDPHLKKLIAFVQESDNDIRSKLTIYSLDFPAINEQQLHAFPKEARHRNILPYILALLCVFLGTSLVYILYRKRKKNKHQASIPIAVQPKQPAALQKNQIYMFGDFTVLDKHGTDISHLFSTQLQQVFCLILFHSHTVGISSKLLSHLLWPDKPKDKAKTSRGVAINNLRKVLSALDGIEIIYENGHYHIQFGPVCYCDYWHLQKLLSNNPDPLSTEVLTILERGKFLMGMDDPLFDKVKNELENTLIETFQQSIAQMRQQKDWPALFRAAKTLLLIDSLNELALKNGLYALHKRKLESRAMLFYKRFAENYQQLMGEDYPYIFEDIWRRKIQ